MENNCLCFFSNSPCIQGLKALPMYAHSRRLFLSFRGLVGMDPQAGVMAMATDVLTESDQPGSSWQKSARKMLL